MVYAQIKDGVIVNTIVVDSKTDLNLFSKDFDDFIRIDDLKQRPGPEWTFDSKGFTSPVPDKAHQAEVVEEKFPWSPDDEKIRKPVSKEDTDPPKDSSPVDTLPTGEVSLPTDLR